MTDTTANACALPRLPNVTELGNAVVVDSAILAELAACTRTEIEITLHEPEKAGLRFETWPPTVQRLVLQEIEKWQARPTSGALVAMTTSVLKTKKGTSCVLILHHKPK